jgi:hypothetical protein
MHRLWGRKIGDLAHGIFLNVLHYIAKKKARLPSLIDSLPVLKFVAIAVVSIPI